MLEDLALMIENTNVTNTFFASNHASNYLAVKVWLPEDRIGRFAPSDTSPPERSFHAQARIVEGPLVDYVEVPLRVRYPNRQDGHRLLRVLPRLSRSGPKRVHAGERCS